MKMELVIFAKGKMDRGDRVLSYCQIWCTGSGGVPA